MAGRSVVRAAVVMVAAAAAVGPLLASCAVSQLGRAHAAGPPLPVATDFFPGSDNPWNQPVPPDAPADPRSAAYVAKLRDDQPPVVSVSRFAVPIYRADAATPRYHVTPTASYASPDLALPNVPVPDGAAPDLENDGHMTVYDAGTRCVYDFYRARRSADGWSAEWVNATPSDGDGVYPDGLSSRASGFSAAAGLIWPEELAAGHIAHAVFFAYPLTRAHDLVGEATRTDGRSSDPDALPLGARLVLDPSIDVDALGLDPTRRTIARALQEYGMVLADSSRGFTLWAVNPQSYPENPYAGTLGNVEYYGLRGIPFDRMKVLPLGPIRGKYDGPPIRNRCSEQS